MTLRTCARFGLATLLMLGPPAGVHAQADPVFAHGFEADPCGPPGYTRASTAETLEEHWRATTFPPLSYSSLARIHFSTGTFFSLRFDRATFTAISGDIIQMNVDTSNIGGNDVRGGFPRHTSISTCPGGFTGLPAGCTQPVQEGPVLYLNFGEPFGISGICDLDPDRAYYLNFIFDDPVDGWQPAAPCNEYYQSTFCGFRAQFQ